MIFENYKKYFIEEDINFNDYVSDGETEDFHTHFFNDESAKKKGFWNGLKSLWNGIINASSIKFDTPQESGRIGYLKHHSIKHILLIVPQDFITKMTNEARRRENIRPNEYIQTFINNFTQSFENNGIQCTFIVHGAPNDRNDRSTKYLGQWLNLDELKDRLTLDDGHGYLLGLKDIKITTDNVDDAISVKMTEEIITLGANCSMLIGHDKLFRHAIPSLDSVIKITNFKDDKTHTINFITENITNITSQHQPLVDEYLIRRYFDDMMIDAEDLTLQDIKIIFNETPNEMPITLSKSVATTDENDELCSTKINLRNKYKVNLKHIITPFDTNLKEIHYHVIKQGGKIILVGANQMTKCKNLLLAKVVANIDKRTFTLKNISSSPITFAVVNDIATYKTITSENKITLNAGTDYATDPVESLLGNDTIEINPGHSYTFSNDIKFDNSTISFRDDSIKITYFNFPMGSFTQKLELGRYSLRHFQNGNIIDADENETHGGRVYTNDTAKLLGTEISRTPLILTLEDDTFTLVNSINSNYIVVLNIDDIPEKKLAFGEKTTFTRDELFESGNNTLSILKNDIALLAVEITA